jgi:FixJ family two-component response regulator
LVCKDLPNKEIGEKLNISSRTVEGNRDRIMKKMNVRSVAGLVAYAYSNGLVSDELGGGGG